MDTEFNDFQGELISMALVAEDGREWYESLGCESPSLWVKENVMSVIGVPPIDIYTFRTSLSKWFLKYNSVHIIADWPEDIAHFCKVLITGPGMKMSTPHLKFEIFDILYFSNIPHNALEDARAIKKSFLAEEDYWKKIFMVQNKTL